MPTPGWTGLLHQSGLADFQHAAYLSAGWRPDSSIAPLVCDGTCPEFDGGHDHRSARRGWVHHPRGVDAIHLVWRSRRFHADELLERIAAGASPVASGKVAASRRVCLSVVQSRAADRELLEMRTVRAALRYLPKSSCLSALLDPVCDDEMSGLWARTRYGSGP